MDGRHTAGGDGVVQGVPAEDSALLIRHGT
jgi:hypothetical protein